MTMDYQIFNMSSGEEELGTVPHVFARAYQWAWRSLYGSDPTGRHTVTQLQLVMVFDKPDVGRVGPLRVRVTPAARTVEPASAAADGAPGDQHDT
jgi:hypothetical protein